MGIGNMYVVVVQKFTFAISSPDEFLLSCDAIVVSPVVGASVII